MWHSKCHARPFQIASWPKVRATAVVTSRKPQAATQPSRPPRKRPNFLQLRGPSLQKARARRPRRDHLARVRRNAEKLPPEPQFLLLSSCPTIFHFVCNRCSQRLCVSHSTGPAGCTKKSTTANVS